MLHLETKTGNGPISMNRRWMLGLSTKNEDQNQSRVRETAQRAVIMIMIIIV